MSLMPEINLILVPGLRDSEAGHWQSLWHQLNPHWLRIRQRNWEQVDLEAWIDAISREQKKVNAPLLLVGHSFGALASVVWANRHPQLTAGVVLVAPAEPMRFGLDDEILPRPLAVPGLMIASHTDPLLSFARAQFWAQAWGCELADIGEAGHIKVESGFGDWPWGRAKLETFAAQLAANSSR